MDAKRTREPPSVDGDDGDPDVGKEEGHGGTKRRRILVISQYAGPSSGHLIDSAPREENPDPSSPPHGPAVVVAADTDLGFLQAGRSTTTTEAATTTGGLPRRDDGVPEMLGQKRLLLVLDLDHTLMHSIDGDDLSPQELYLLQEAHQVEGEGQRPLLFDRRSTIGYLIKLRPFVHTFLREASTMYDFYICTMSGPVYAEEIARILDPGGLYFSSANVISCFDFTVSGMKGLDVVRRGDKRTTVILDDKLEVWPKKHWGNLLVVPAYHYFSSSRIKLGDHWQAPSELRRDERRIVLATILDILQRAHHRFFDGSSEGDLLTRDVRPILREITKKTTIPRILQMRKDEDGGDHQSSPTK